MNTPRKLLLRLVRSGLGCFIASSALAAVGADLPDASGLQLAEPVAAGRGPASLSRAADYVVTLSSPSLAKQYKNSGRLTKAQQKAHVQKLTDEQDKVVDRVRQLGGKDLVRLNKALNGIVVSINARMAQELAQTAGVASVRPVNRYEIDLSETVPYIGAAAVQAGGNTGAGIRVAVLDSGIDYTHTAFGGAGTVAAYKAAYGTSTTDPKAATTDGLFPTAKVVGGYDFVGEAWPNGPLAPDSDPIDCSPSAIGCGGGHGTHVADIIGGMTPGHVGVAPGALLYAVKVCSSVATSCSGLALLQAVDFALDPDGNGDIADHVDVINLSLGSSYGQDEDDLTAALNNAADLGVVVVASAGNSADRPYIAGSPSTGRNVISVAQTQVPSAKLYKIVAGTVTVGGSWQGWSATPTLVSGQLAYNSAPTSRRIGCLNGSGGNPYAAGEYAGKILLMDRGTCAVSFKVANAAAAGAIAAIIANNVSQAPGDLPPDFSYGGGDPSIAGYTVTLTDGNALRTVIGVPTAIDPASAASLAGNMVSSSSRGPSFSRNTIKPDIGAPGASVSAEVGTGTGTTAFGGTSGAAPMVTGTVALLLKARPGLSPTEVKSILMNTGETNIGINPVALPGVLAPITRIGGGEVRINKAAASQTAAWDKKDEAGSLSFGYYPTATKTTVERTIVVRNFGRSSRTYVITPSFRYANDASSGAVKLSTPRTIKVGGGEHEEFTVLMTLDPAKLNLWALNGGGRGGDGYRLQSNELDGYIKIDGGANNTVNVAWQVLTHRAADVSADGGNVALKSNGTGQLKLRNKSDVLDGRFEVFALTGQSDQITTGLPKPGDNFAVVDLKAVGVRMVDLGGVPGVQFAIDTYGARSHPNYPAEFDVYIDANNDGTPESVIFNLENGGFAVTGQNVVASGPLASPAIRFLADADLNSGNMILTAPLSALGLTPGTTFTFSVYAFDNYFTGNLTDAIEGMKYTLDTPRFAPSAYDGVVPMGGSSTLGVARVTGGDVKSPSQQGLLLMYRDAQGKSRKDVGKDEAQVIVVTP
jgi:subtilisin family serine protease